MVSQPGGVGTAFVVNGSHLTRTQGQRPAIGHIRSGFRATSGLQADHSNTANVADSPIVLTGPLNPASDSGLATGTVERHQRQQPDFYGSSEPLDRHPVATPLFPGGTPIHDRPGHAGSDGSWNITSVVPLADGHYSITATAIDQFGITSTGPIVITSNLTVDTHGPVIGAMYFNRLNGQVDYIIQDPVLTSGMRRRVSGPAPCSTRPTTC